MTREPARQRYSYRRRMILFQDQVTQRGLRKSNICLLPRSAQINPFSAQSHESLSLTRDSYYK